MAIYTKEEQFEIIKSNSLNLLEIHNQEEMFTCSKEKWIRYSIFKIPNRRDLFSSCKMKWINSSIYKIVNRRNLFRKH